MPDRLEPVSTDDRTDDRTVDPLDGVQADGVQADGSRRRRRLAPFVVAGVALVVGALFYVLVSAGVGTADLSRSPLLGKPAPAAHGEYADGSTFELSRRKGSWVVLNFFTHTCVPCIREHPALIEFVDQQRALGVDGAEFYSIVRDSTREEVEQFFAQRGGDWPIVFDTDFEFSNDFGVALVPETWIIDPAGIVRQRIPSEVDGEQLSRLLQAYREAAS
ncbi:MAG: TlpA disulfide reductase family protein [Ilumatobacteraceae bacterium]